LIPSLIKYYNPQDSSKAEVGNLLQFKKTPNNFKNRLKNSATSENLSSAAINFQKDKY